MTSQEKEKMKEAMASSPAGLAALNLLLENPDPVTSYLIELTGKFLGIREKPVAEMESSPSETPDQKPD